MAHWLCIRLPNLPLELFSRGGSERQPLAVTQPGRRASVLLCNAAARRQGVRPGLSVAAARALDHTLVTKPRDEQAEQQALSALAAWVYRFSAQVSLYSPCELVLEVQGSFMLYGGHDALLDTLRTGLLELGYQARLCGAPTPLAAISLARCHREQHIRAPAALADALASLPVSVLDWEQDRLDRLAGIGVRRLGALWRLPRDGLARRFGSEALLYLDRMLGRVAHPQSLYSPPAQFQRRQQLPADVEDTQALLFVLQRLLLEMCGWLQGLAAAIQQFDVLLWHREGRVTRLRVGTYQPGRDAAQLLVLLRERLERLQLEAGVSEVGLRAGSLSRLAAESRDLFATAAPAGQVNLLDRLRARLGDTAVSGLSAVAEHRPERAWCYSAPGKSRLDCHWRQRPLWLLPEPRPLKAIDGRPRLQGELTLESDTERIESGWWDDAGVARDYYIATTTAGSRYWIYRELDGARGWYLQGVFE